MRSILWRGIGGLILFVVSAVCLVAILAASPHVPEWRPAAVALSVISWAGLGLFGIYLNIRAGWDFKKAWDALMDEARSQDAAPPGDKNP